MGQCKKDVTPLLSKSWSWLCLQMSQHQTVLHNSVHKKNIDPSDSADDFAKRLMILLKIIRQII